MPYEFSVTKVSSDNRVTFTIVEVDAESSSETGPIGPVPTNGDILRVQCTLESGTGTTVNPTTWKTESGTSLADQIGGAYQGAPAAAIADAQIFAAPNAGFFVHRSGVDAGADNRIITTYTWRKGV